MPPAKDRPSQALSASTLRAYAADWALFTDWCDATDQQSLPADPGTVLGFLAGCPAAVKTQRGRVTAIDHQHTATGYAPPGHAPAVLTALGRPVPGPYQPASETVAAVHAALRVLPSHGWTKGMFGRRDRCLLVLSQLAGIPYTQLAALTVGDITLAGGIFTIRTPAGQWSLRPDDDPVVCGPCAVVRWLRIVSIADRSSTSHLAYLLGKAKTVTSTSLHLCRSARRPDPAAAAAPVLASIDQWGAVAFPHPPLSVHSQSRRTRESLTGEFVTHRDLPFPIDDHHPTPPPAPAPAPVINPPQGYGKAAAARAWAKRRADLTHLAGVADTLSDIDARIAALQHRVNTLLDGETR